MTNDRITYMLDAGKNPRTVQEFVGHSDPGFMLRQYAHVLEKSKKEASEAFLKSLFSSGILSKNRFTEMTLSDPTVGKL